MNQFYNKCSSRSTWEMEGHRSCYGWEQPRIFLPSMPTASGGVKENKHSSLTLSTPIQAHKHSQRSICICHMWVQSLTLASMWAEYLAQSLSGMNNHRGQTTWFASICCRFPEQHYLTGCILPVPESRVSASLAKSDTCMHTENCMAQPSSSDKMQPSPPARSQKGGKNSFLPL